MRARARQQVPSVCSQTTMAHFSTILRHVRTVPTQDAHEAGYNACTAENTHCQALAAPVHAWRLQYRPAASANSNPRTTQTMVLVNNLIRFSAGCSTMGSGTERAVIAAAASPAPPRHRRPMQDIKGFPHCCRARRGATRHGARTGCTRRAGPACRWRAAAAARAGPHGGTPGAGC